VSVVCTESFFFWLKGGCIFVGQNKAHMIRKITLWAVLALVLTPALSQAQQTDYKFHTVFMYNFTKYVKWPEGAVTDRFVIGVLGSSGIVPHLEQMASTKSVNGKPIELKVFSSPAEVANCHMLFVPENRSNELASLRSSLATQPTLIVTEKAGLARAGSDINFVVDNGRWKFELNEAANAMHQLKVSSELTKFASKIYTEI
jgi:hypothetical protein